jgi:ABC-2 type transport system permease protein
MTRLLLQLRIENSLFLRDRTVVAFHVLLPALLLLLLTQVHGNMLTLRWTVGFADPRPSDDSQALIEQLRAIPGIVVVEGEPAELHMLAANGRLGALVHLSDERGTGPTGHVRVEGDSQVGTVVAAILDGLVARASGREARVVGPSAPSGLVPSEPVFAAVLLPGVIGMVVASVGLFGFGAQLASYRQRGFLRWISITPVGVRDFLLAQSIHRLCFVVLQTTVLLALGRAIVGGAEHVEILSFLVTVGAGAFAFIGVGFLVGTLASSGEAASGWCHLLFFPQLLLSGAFYPVSALPGFLQLAAPFLPLSYLLDGLHRSFSGIGGVAGDVAVLAAFGVVGLAVAARILARQTA